MAKVLKLASNLVLPVEAVTQTIAILAKRRAGKSYTMRRIVEQLFKAGQQVVLVDPKGDQWGIRSSVDGKSPGLPIIIFGGERGDVPLEVGAGELVAKLVVEDRVSALLDLSLFRKREVAVFMTAFLESLYRLKAKEVYRTPVMLVIDEADAIAPQKPQDGEERMLGAAEDIVRRGGQRGLGCILVTQRSAVLNKNVLTQAEMLIALRTIAPQDLKAMNEWIDVHGTPEQRKTLMESLPSLPIGDAWFWSPGWPTGDGIFQRVHVLPIETFDSGASPKPGVKPIEVKTLADVDIDAVKGQMAETLERAKADDPRELKKQLADVRRQLDAALKNADVKKTSTSLQTKDVPVLTDADRAVLCSLIEVLGRRRTRESEFGDLVAIQAKAENRLNELFSNFRNGFQAELDRLFASDEAQLGKKSLQRILDKLDRVAQANPKSEPIRQAAPRPTPERNPAVGRSSGAPSVGGRSGDGARPAGAKLQPAQQRILNALAWLNSIRIQGWTREVVAFVAGASSRSSAFANNVSALRTAGYLEYPQQNHLALTDAGTAQAVPPDAPLRPQDLHRQIQALLQPAQWRIVEAAIAAYPKELTRAQLAAEAGASDASSAFANNVSRVRTLGLIDYPRQGYIVGTPLLFLEGR